jgi:phosphatidylserine/phosphatidylglycerophosphate/cardiolipin synthase-like enzyme
MATFADGKIEVFAGPTDLGAPDDLEAVIVDFIGGAKRSLDIAVQEIDSEPIAQAILDARWRGVKVAMVIEQDYLRAGRLPKPPKPRSGETPGQALERWQWSRTERGLGQNRRVLSTLLKSGVDVKADFNKDIFHQKFILRDFRARQRKGPSSALLSGSANFTETGCHKNLNHVFVFHDKGICGEYREEFDEIARGEFGRRQHGDVPRTHNLSGVPVMVLFAPDHTPELEVIKRVLTAQEEVRFAIFTFSGSSGIDDALLMTANAGRKVLGALDPGQAAHKWAAPRGVPGAAPPWLKQKNISLYTPRREGGFGKLHHKLMAIDRSTVVAGSFNYTAPANAYNDENVFVVGSPYELPKRKGGPVDAAACREIADYMRNEIERIVKGSDPWEP